MLPEGSLSKKYGWTTYNDGGKETFIMPRKKIKWKSFLTVEEYITFLNSKDYRDEIYESNHVSKIIGLEEEEEDILISVPKGIYRYESFSLGDEPERLVPFEVRDDEYLKNDYLEETISDIKNFLNNRKLYESLGSIFKRGYFYYGPPGNGKTALLRQVIKYLQNNEDCITLYITESRFPSVPFLENIKHTMKDKLKLFVFDELISKIESSNLTEQLLNFLDGEVSIDGSISFATTNYPEKLPDSIMNRPSRFDKLIRVNNPDEKTRRLIFNTGLKMEVPQTVIELTKDLSVAACKEVIIRSTINKISIEEAIESVKNHKKEAGKRFDEVIIKDNGVGFN